MQNKFLLLGLMLVGTLRTGLAQTFDTGRLDSMLTMLAENNKLMVSVAVAKEGKLLYSRATGQAAVMGQSGIPATPATRYRIGSVTKMFTAAIIFQIISEGKLELSASIETFFPAVPNAAKITIGNLLNHRSGLHNFTDDPAYPSYMTSPKTPDEMLRIIEAAQPDFEPGSRTAYSNSNYVLLGQIIEKVTGATYAENLEKRISKKLGLTETGFGTAADIARSDSYSYTFTEDAWKQLPETDLSVPGAAGGIVATPRELTQFITALFSGKLVPAAALNQMKQIVDGMGMGLFPMPFYDKLGYGHQGSIDGFLTTLAYFEKDGLAVAVCANGANYSLNDVLIAVLSSYYKRPFYLPVLGRSAVTADMLTPYLGTYSSPQLPLMITVKASQDTLVAQATGQSAFPLTPVKKDVFSFEKAGIVMEFIPDRSEFVLRQNGGVFVFKREY